MEYTQNWAWDCSCDVELEKEIVGGRCKTDGQGQIKYLTLDRTLSFFISLDRSVYDMENPDDLSILKSIGIVAIHFTTPAKLEL